VPFDLMAAGPEHPFGDPFLRRDGSCRELLEEIAANRCFGGWHRRYRHHSQVLGCEMVFAVYLPPQADRARCRRSTGFPG
jgi:hypothetical protein